MINVIMIPQKEMHNQREKIQKFLNYIEIKIKISCSYNWTEIETNNPRGQKQFKWPIISDKIKMVIKTLTTED